jgi:hypothetical protein
MDLELVFIGLLLARLGLAPLFLRRVVLTWWLGRVGHDLGLALLAFQAVDFVPQPLILGLQVPKVGAHCFDQVQQPDNEFPGIFVLDIAQINLVKHKLAILHIRYRNANWRLLLSSRGFPPVY